MVLVRAKQHRFAVPEMQLCLRCVFAFGEWCKHVFVVNDAVLKYFRERGATECVGLLQYFAETHFVRVDGAREELCAGSEYELSRRYRRIDGT